MITLLDSAYTLAVLLARPAATRGADQLSVRQAHPLRVRVQRDAHYQF